MSWRSEKARQERATKLAEELVANLGFTKPPIDPLKIAEGEKPLLVAKGGDLGSMFDGQIEFHRSKRRFVLLFNTKYNTDSHEHHPRTRFSVAHELGHFYIPEHNAYLSGGGAPHRSHGEFTVDTGIEREADAFASGLLMPRQIVWPMIRGREISIRLVNQVAEQFKMSRVATAWRSVAITDQPCALFALRGGRVAWRQVSEMAIQAGCYPKKDRGLRSNGARQAWEAFEQGVVTEFESESTLADWFDTYDREHLEEVVVSEQYLPIPIMGTILVLVTMDEEDVFAS